MDNLTALTYLPQDQLSLAYLHEVRELNRYRGLALSFLPFDPPISRLMDAIGMECVHRLCSLQEVASQMELGACANANQQKEPRRPQVPSATLLKSARAGDGFLEHLGVDFQWRAPVQCLARPCIE